jgi:hypothetical protein
VCEHVMVPGAWHLVKSRLDKSSFGLLQLQRHFRTSASEFEIGLFAFIVAIRVYLYANLFSRDFDEV